jgi:diguanylate cyclase (GGDEF)-like protein
MERTVHFAPLPISPPASVITERSELDVLFSRMSELLSLDENQASETGVDSEAGGETEVALRLALIAMTEAEKWIERQEHRIKELEDLSITDELTRLLNRRGFSMQLQRALAFAARGDSGGSVIMIDLDRFKLVNDTYGHAAGDALLQTVAESLKHRVRETDTIGRLGGDEFAVLMPGISKEIATKRIDALDRDLNGRTFQWEIAQIPLGASLSLAHYTGTDDEFDVLKRADEAMYRAKFKCGKNQRS